MSCARLERGSNLKPSQAIRLGPSTRVCVSALPPLVYPRRFHVSDRRPAARLAAAIRVAAPDGRLDADREWRVRGLWLGAPPPRATPHSLPHGLHRPGGGGSRPPKPLP